MANPSEQGQWPEGYPPSHPTHGGEEPHQGSDEAQAPPIPFPSQLVQLSHMGVPASYSLSEELPAADPRFKGLPDDIFVSYSPAAGQSFAEQANDMINAALNRTSVGTSVVDPDSVLGVAGRLYHGFKEGKYFLPNDAAEQDRLDFQHELWRLILHGRLSWAPMEYVPSFVLDVGTGTGIWANEFAEQYPASYVIGTDLSAIQPEPKVPNCAFIKDDSEAPWLFPLPSLRGHHCEPGCDHRISFDYIHLRAMFTCFNDHRVIIRQAFENLKAGGWIEYQDSCFDIFQANPAFEGNAVIRFCEGCNQGLSAKGRDPDVSKKLKDYFQEAGFVDVEEKKLVVPCSPWPQDARLKRIGDYQLQNVLELVKSGGLLLRAGGMEPNDIEQLQAEVAKECLSINNHIYGFTYVVFGRKPFKNESADSSGPIGDVPGLADSAN